MAVSCLFVSLCCKIVSGHYDSLLLLEQWKRLERNSEIGSFRVLENRLVCMACVTGSVCVWMGENIIVFLGLFLPPEGGSEELA